MRQHPPSLTLTTAALALAAALTLVLVTAPAWAQAEAAPTAAKEFDVYVELATGNAYIKTPAGWRYIRQLDEAQLQQLPPTTLTTLAATDAQAVQLAYQRAGEASVAGRPPVQK